MTIYTHKHHIIPKHMGGTDDPENIIELTVDEHALAHKDLYEKHGKFEDYLAWKALSGQIGSEEVIRQKLSFAGKKGGSKSKGKKQTKEHIEKRLSSIGNVNPFFGKTHTEESKEKIRKLAIGNTRNKKTWELVFEDGVIIIENLNAWCKENGYNYSGIHTAYQEKRPYKDIKKISKV